MPFAPAARRKFVGHVSNLAELIWRDGMSVTRPSGTKNGRCLGMSAESAGAAKRAEREPR